MDEPADASDVGSGSEGAVLFAEGADVSDVGVGVDALASLIEELIIADLAGGVDWIGIDEDMITVEDLGWGLDEISFADWNAIAISDEGVSADRVWLYRSQVVIDSTVLPHVDSVDVTEPSIVATKPASTGPPLRLWISNETVLRLRPLS